jgi:hypothetical protein
MKALIGVFFVDLYGYVTGDSVFDGKMLWDELLLARPFMSKHPLKLLFASDPLVPLHEITNVFLVFVNNDQSIG